MSQATGITRWWIGKANREDLTPPVAALRSSAQGVGLVHKRKGRLLLTPAGRRARGNPAALWDHLVAHLPAGRRPEERQAGLLALLTAAADRGPWFSRFAEATEVVRQIGWHNADGPITEDAVIECARPTWEVLRALDAGERSQLPAAAAARARAALCPA